MIDVATLVGEAELRIREHVIDTPVVESQLLRDELGARVGLKCENLQHTGSFKVRGALNKLLALDATDRARGVVTASTGNHGAAVAHAARVVGCRATVFVPNNAAATKLAAIERRGAEIVAFGDDCIETEQHARAVAESEGRAYVSPYNDPLVVGGQGTVAFELMRQMPDVETVYVALGGGGLVAGIAGHLKAVAPQVRIVACSPVNSCVMIESVRAGRVLDLSSEPTLSDGTAGGVEADTVTFPVVRELVDDYETVTEDEIRAAFLDLLDSEHLLVEGAAAMAYAACRKHARRVRPRSGLAVVLCGANIGVEKVREVIDADHSA